MAFEDKGITGFGFERPNLQEIIDDIRTDFVNAFGSDVLTTDDSVIGQFISIFADRENELWKILDAIYTSQTLTGAEGIHLNNLLGRIGVERKDKSAGTGFAFIETAYTTPNTTIIPSSDTQISATNGKTYILEDDISVSDSVGAFRVYKDLITERAYNFTITDISDNTDYVFSYNLSTADLDDAAIELFFIALKAFIVEHTRQENSELIYRDEVTGDLLIGYDSDGVVIGILNPTKMFFNTEIANRFSAIPVICNETGFFPLGSNQLTSITPEPIGFASIFNPEPFFSGSEIETDAEYRIRYAIEPLSSAKATRDSIVNALFDLSGVSAVKIYKNIDGNVVDSPADPYTFLTVVRGGLATEIAQAIYDNMPIDGITSGSVSTSIPTSDGDTEIINFEPAVGASFDIDITYGTKFDIPLTSEEQIAIKDNISDLFSSLSIGDKIYYNQIISAIYTAVGFTKILDLTVGIKRSVDSIFSFTNIQLTSFEFATISDNDISFKQELV